MDNTPTVPLEPVHGSFDIAITWKPGTTPEQMEAVKPLIDDCNEQVNGPDADNSDVPECVQAITFSRVA